MVYTGTRNARATSCVYKPPSVCSVSAICFDPRKVKSILIFMRMPAVQNSKDLSLYLGCVRHKNYSLTIDALLLDMLN